MSRPGVSCLDPKKPPCGPSLVLEMPVLGFPYLRLERRSKCRPRLQAKSSVLCAMCNLVEFRVSHRDPERRPKATATRTCHACVRWIDTVDGLIDGSPLHDRFGTSAATIRSA